MCGMSTIVLPEKYLPALKGEDRENLSLCQGFENVRSLSLIAVRRWLNLGADVQHDSHYGQRWATRPRRDRCGGKVSEPETR